MMVRVMVGLIGNETHGPDNIACAVQQSARKQRNPSQEVLLKHKTFQLRIILN